MRVDASGESSIPPRWFAPERVGHSRAVLQRREWKSASHFPPRAGFRAYETFPSGRGRGVSVPLTPVGPWVRGNVLMAQARPPGVGAASVMYDAGLSRDAIVARLQDPVMMSLMREPRAYSEAEAIAAYDAVAI